MESDPDRSEESSESEEEGYFDLMKRFTTKKTLPAVNHSDIDYKAFKKNFYIQVKEITLMKDHEVEEPNACKVIYRAWALSGSPCPFACLSHVGFWTVLFACFSTWIRCHDASKPSFTCAPVVVNAEAVNKNGRFVV